MEDRHQGSIDCSSDGRGSRDPSPAMGRPGLLGGGGAGGGGRGFAQRRGNVGFNLVSNSAPPRSVAFAGFGASMRSSLGFGGSAVRSSFRNLRYAPGGVTSRNQIGGEDSMSFFDFDPTSAVEEDVPLDLHAACRTCDSLRELRLVFRAVVNEKGGHKACSAEEASGGRLPLHCIGLNRELLLLCTGGRAAWGQIEKFILDELIPAHQVAVTEEDDKGRIPFTEAIHDWVQARRAVRQWRTVQAEKKKSKLRVTDRLRKTLSGISSKALVNTDEMQRLSSNQEKKDDDDSSLGSIHILHSDDKQCPSNHETNTSHPCEATKQLVEEHEEDDEGPSDLPPLVEFCLRLLSAIIDQPPSSPGKNKKRSSVDDETLDDDGTAGSSGGWSAMRLRSSRVARRQTLLGFSDAIGSFYADFMVEKVASIPNLIQELLLIEDKDARSRIFDMSVVRRVLLCKKSFGNGAWLNRMLIKGAEVTEFWKRKQNLDSSIHSSTRSVAIDVKGVPDPRDYAEGAVFYLERISALSPYDLASPGARAKKKVSTGEIHNFREQRDELFSAVGGMDNLITNMIVLDDDLSDRVAVTCVVQRALDEVMSLPMATTKTFLDFITHILFILSFRAGPCRAMFNVAAANESFNPHTYMLWWMVLLLVCSYFFYQKVNQMIAKYCVSKKLFLANLRTNIWTQVDLLSPVLVISASIAIDRGIRDPPRWSGEEDTHVQYLRFWAASATGLAWLKLMGHIKMLNKHLATFVLCLMEIMKDIKFFLIVLTITLAAFAQMFVSMMHGTQPGQPEYGSMHIYFKAYGIMLGDFDTTNFSSGFLSLLFVLYTFIVTIVLLNILIAIVSNSYDRSVLSSKTLFGKARVLFVADLMAIHTIYELIESGRLRRNFRPFLLGIETVFAALCTKMALTTVRVRAGDSLQSLAVPIEAEVAALFGIFLLLGSIMFKLRMLSYIRSMEVYAVKSGKKRPKSHHSALSDVLTYYIFKIQSLVINYLDYSNDNSDLEIKALMNASEDDTLTSEEKHASGINRTLSHLRKQMKAENKQSTQQLSNAFQASEERVQQEMQDLEERLIMCIAESEERIASIVSPPSEEAIAQAVARIMLQNQGSLRSSGDSQADNSGQTDETQNVNES